MDAEHYVSASQEACDIILGHGNCAGKISEIFGDNGFCNSELAMSLASTFLTTSEDGIVLYFDQRRTIVANKVADWPMVKSSRFACCWCPASEELFVTLERTLLRIRDRNAEIPVLIVVDSVAALLADAKHGQVPREKAIAEIADTLSGFFKRVTPWLPRTNCHLVFLNPALAEFHDSCEEGDDESPIGKEFHRYADNQIQLTMLGSRWVAEPVKVPGHHCARKNSRGIAPNAKIGARRMVNRWRL